MEEREDRMDKQRDDGKSRRYSFLHYGRRFYSNQWQREQLVNVF